MNNATLTGMRMMAEKCPHCGGEINPAAGSKTIPVKFARTTVQEVKIKKRVRRAVTYVREDLFQDPAWQAALEMEVLSRR
jgi:hypothetical protein